MRTLALALLVQAMVPWLGVGAPSLQVPPRVAEITRKQIERYLGTNDLKGVPLLDRTVDWNSFTNWPDQFSFKGLTYHLQLTDTSGGDYFVGITNRMDVRPGMHFLAGYRTGTNFPPALGVSSGWSGNGSVVERIVDVQGKRVFGHQFFATGQFYLFLRDDAETKAYALEYFDGSGRLIGTDTWTGTKQKCEWDGVIVDHDTLMKRFREMYKRVMK